MHDDILPTSVGLLRCLQALAEESASLGLILTHIAIQQAISQCRAETRMPLSAIDAPQVDLIH